MASVFILDSTLREGTQAPGVRFTEEDCAQIVDLLVALNIDTVECAHPFASDRSRSCVKRIVQIRNRPCVLSHARCRRGDVEAVVDCGAEWVGIFLGFNEISRETRLRSRSETELLTILTDVVGYAKKIGLKVRYTLQDASRTPLALRDRVFAAAIDAGADRICLADTVGVFEPKDVEASVKALRERFAAVPLEVHMHDDRGLAMANTLAAVEAGAAWVSCSVNGLGERCGITDLGQLVANLQFTGLRKLSSPNCLHKLSRLVGALSRSPADHRRPVVGRNAFSHTSPLHRKATDVRWNAYTWTDPASVGRTLDERRPELPGDPTQLSHCAVPRSATELAFHRHGPGTRYFCLDEKVIPDCRQYCIVRHIPSGIELGEGHVDEHRHDVDSLFVFLGFEVGLCGLSVEVQLGVHHLLVSSPASVFIPAGVRHSYRVLRGSGLFVNHVLSGSYNASLLE